MIVCPEAYTNICQSMLYIDNLSKCVELLVENISSGVFHPQDNYAPNTVEMIEIIRSVYGKRTRKSKLFGLFVKMLSKLSLIRKIYGGIMYSDDLSDFFDKKYQIVDFKKGLETTIRNNV